MKAIALFVGHSVVIAALGWGVPGQASASGPMSAQQIIEHLKPRGAKRNFVVQEQLPEPVVGNPVLPLVSPSEQPGNVESIRETPAAPTPSVSLVVQFQINSHQVTPIGMEQLVALASALTSPELAQLPFHVEGHTDRKGSDEFNQRLSERRATEVMRQLVRLGVARIRLTASGHGSNHLLPDLPADSAQHRRVVIRRVS